MRLRQLTHRLVLIVPLVLGLVLAVACTSHDYQVRHSKHGTGVVEGTVTGGGSPLAGATVRATSSSTLTGADGRFVLRGLSAASRLPVHIEARGFRTTTRIIELGSNRTAQLRVLLQPLAEPVAFDAGRGGEFTFGSVGRLTIPPGSLVGETGQRAEGPASIRLTPIDVSSDEGLRSAPGDFTARQADGSLVVLDSFGMVDVQVESAAGQSLDLASGATAELTIPISENRVASAPRVVGQYRFDRSQGRWLEEGEMTRGPEGLAYTGTVESFDGEWNADEPLETTCIMVRVLDLLSDPRNQPIAGVTVSASGVNYASISQGETNQDGDVCLLVKRNEDIELQASSPVDPNRASQTRVVRSPDIASGEDDCGDCFDCPPVATLLLDLIVG